MSTNEFKRYTVDTAPEGSRGIMKDIQGSYGFMPELFAYMAESPEMLEAYVTVNKLLSKTSLTPAQQQLILLAISRKNGCDFCQKAHEAVGLKSGLDKDTIAALKDDKDIKNSEYAALVTLARTIVEKRGWLEDDDLAAFYNAGFGPKQVMEVILGVSLKTLSNYTNHLSHPEPNPELLDMIGS
jgi:uncharacterized peroxidase-related enzyme